MANESGIADMYNCDNNDDDNATFELPAPPGWKKLFTPRKIASALRNDVLFVSPSGEEIKSKRGLGQYLKSHPSEPPVSSFDWGTGDTPRRSTRISEKQKIVEAHEAEKPAKRAKLSAPKKGKQEQSVNPGHKHEENLRDDHLVPVQEVKEAEVSDHGKSPDNSYPVEKPEEGKILDEAVPAEKPDEGKTPDMVENPDEGKTPGESVPAEAEAVGEPVPMVIEEQGRVSKPEDPPKEKEEEKTQPEVVGEQQSANGCTHDSNPEPEPETEPAVVGEDKCVAGELGGAEEEEKGVLADAVEGASVDNGLEGGGGAEKVSPGRGASLTTGCAANGQEVGSEGRDNCGVEGVRQV